MGMLPLKLFKIFCTCYESHGCDRTGSGCSSLCMILPSYFASTQTSQDYAGGCLHRLGSPVG
eukprot:scaffold256674_cov23-Prasinocladus_malaysianus.AAC.1